MTVLQTLLRLQGQVELAISMVEYRQLVEDLSTNGQFRVGDFEIKDTHGTTQGLPAERGETKVQDARAGAPPGRGDSATLEGALPAGLPLPSLRTLSPDQQVSQRYVACKKCGRPGATMHYPGGYLCPGGCKEPHFDSGQAFIFEP